MNHPSLDVTPRLPKISSMPPRTPKEIAIYNSTSSRGTSNIAYWRGHDKTGLKPTRDYSEWIACHSIMQRSRPPSSDADEVFFGHSMPGTLPGLFRHYYGDCIIMTHLAKRPTHRNRPYVIRHSGKTLVEPQPAKASSSRQKSTICGINVKTGN